MTPAHLAFRIRLLHLLRSWSSTGSALATGNHRVVKRCIDHHSCGRFVIGGLCYADTEGTWSDAGLHFFLFGGLSIF